MRKEQKFISVVAYMHNEAEHVTPFLSQVMEYCETHFERCELILVNDASDDGSLDVVHDYYRAHPAGYMVSIIKMGIFQGLEASMNAGRDMAIGDYVFEFDDMDADYESSVILEAYQRCLAGNDIVSVASDVRMHLTSRWFYRVFNRVTRARNEIGQATFRLLSRRAINRVKSMGAYIPYRKAVYMNCGLSVENLVYPSTREGQRVTGHSNRNERADLAIDSFIYFTNVMERVALCASAVFLLIALAVVVYVIVSFFTDEQTVSGWVSLMGFLAISFTGLFGLLTIVIKYLSVLVNLVFRRQRYLIEDVEKISGK